MGYAPDGPDGLHTLSQLLAHCNLDQHLKSICCTCILFTNYMHKSEQLLLRLYELIVSESALKSGMSVVHGEDFTVSFTVRNMT